MTFLPVLFYCIVPRLLYSTYLKYIFDVFVCLNQVEELRRGDREDCANQYHQSRGRGSRLRLRSSLEVTRNHDMISLHVRTLLDNTSVEMPFNNGRINEGMYYM